VPTPPVSSAYEDASSSGELWNALTAHAGLQPDDYDEPLEAALRQRLRLDPQGPMEEQLASQNVSVERFIVAFFEAAAPYVAMWLDLLALFERAAATAGETNLRIAYRFDQAGDLELAFDLHRFRAVAEVVEQLTAQFDLSPPNLPQFVWAIPSAVAPRRWDSASGFPDVDRFAESLRDPRAPWPHAMPRRPAGRTPELDALLAEIWALGETLLRGLREISASHAELMGRGQSESDVVVVCGATHSALRLLQSDYWFPNAISVLSAALAGAEDHPDATESSTEAGADSPAARQRELAVRVDAALAPLRNADPQRKDLRARLAEFLQLPVWEHRYELYSNWVCTQVISALEDHAPRVHADHGEIRFAFSGTHLASFDGFNPRLHLWTEFRAPLAHPVGKGRKKAIQPDITILADPITASRTPLVVECKQYRKASNKNFADAITDYARGHPDARIVLVNYGATRAPAVLSRVDPSLLARTAVVGDLRPDQPEQIKQLRAAVRQAVGAELKTTLPGALTEFAGKITLRWGATPRDLDLHLRIGSTNGQPTEISYKEQGSLDQPPYCALDTDVTSGHGPEEISIARWLPATYTIIVHNYSAETPLAGSGATVTIEHKGESREFRCPDDLNGEEWTVCAIKGRKE
jgi:hypothetical protein